MRQYADLVVVPDPEILKVSNFGNKSVIWILDPFQPLVKSLKEKCS